jgi:uncharacterized protein YgiM (DUF1202 family)
MNKYRKIRIKRKIYKHGNAIAYIGIFAIASFITIASVAGRSDAVMVLDNSQVAVSERESIALKDKDTQKVAAKSNLSDEADTSVAETTGAEAVQTTVYGEKKVGTKVTIIVDTLNVRSQASQDSEPLGMVDEGETFTIISQDSEWIEIDYNGNNGFVKAEFVEID